MRIFRQLSTRRLLIVLALVACVATGATVAGAALTRGAGTPPPAEPLAQAIHDALAGNAPAGVTARVQFTNNLLPSSSLLGNVTSALLSGGTGRLWLTNDGRGRIELQSDAGDAQILWDSSKVTVYDSSSNTAYTLALPSPSSSSSSASDSGTTPSLDEITAALAKLGAHANISDAVPGVIADQPSYSVSVSPKENGGLIGDAELGWAAANGVPLRFAITAKGDATPVLALEVTDITFGAVSSTDVSISPPPGTKIVDVTPQSSGSGETQHAAVTGVDAVRAAVGFPLVAPASVGGQALSSARLVGKGALLTYGEGLGALVVHESAGDAAKLPAALGSLPTVTLGSASAHELVTPLGTVLTFASGGVQFIVGGSMTAQDAEAAAKALA